MGKKTKKPKEKEPSSSSDEEEVKKEKDKKNKQKEDKKKATESKTKETSKNQKAPEPLSESTKNVTLKKLQISKDDQNKYNSNADKKIITFPLKSKKFLKILNFLKKLQTKIMTTQTAVTII